MMTLAVEWLTLFQGHTQSWVTGAVVTETSETKVKLLKLQIVFCW